MKNNIIAVLLAVCVLLPINSFAQILEDIDPNPETSSCISLVNNLKYRSRDANTNGEVSTLQDFLQSKGYLNSEPTGFFGLMTLNAVKAFQTANSISATGYVGPITRAKISILTCQNSSTTTSSPEITSFSALQVDADPVYGGTVMRFDWTSQNTSAVSLVTSGACPAGLTITNATNHTAFNCGDVDRQLAVSGSLYLRFINNTSSPISIQFFLTPIFAGIGNTLEARTITVSIPPSSVTASVVVTSPNGGETWTSGTSRVITWYSTNYTGNVDIRLLEGSAGSGGSYIALNVPNSGSYTWSIPSNFTAGQYRVQVALVGGGTVNDTSNNLFTISGTTSTSISVANAPEVPSASITQGVQNQILGGFAVSVVGEPISVGGMVFTVSAGPGFTYLNSNITDATIVDENGAVVAGPVDSPTSLTNQTLTFSDPVTFPVGRHVYKLKGKIPSAALNSTIIQSRTTPSSWTSPIGQTTGNPITISTGEITMNPMTINGTTFSVGVDAASPNYSVVLGNSKGVTTGIYKIRAMNGDVRLTKLGLKLTSGSFSDIDAVLIYQGTTVVGVGTFSGATTVITLNTPVFLPKDTNVEFTIKADFSGTGASPISTEGSLVKIDPLSAEGVIVASGQTIQAFSAVGGVAGVKVFVFTDVSASDPALAAILSMADKNIMIGVGNGLFLPNDVLTRGQAAVTAVRRFNLSLDDLPTVATFQDVPTTHYYWKFIESIYRAGLTTGCSGTPKLFCPDAPITRAQYAVFLTRGMGLDPASAPQTPYFSDVPATNIYFPFIQHLYQKGITAGCGINPLRYCPDDNTLRWQAAMMLDKTPGGTLSQTSLQNYAQMANVLESARLLLEELLNKLK